jgi:Flp pilus assembly protein TadD
MDFGGRALRTVAFSVVLAAAVALSGCSSLVGGSSAFGNSKQVASADLPSIGNMTADAALGEARGHFRNNDFGYSAALYKKVVELSPKDPQGYIGLGASYDRLGRFDLSDRVYATLYAITGETAQYDNNLGYSYMLRGNLTQALVSFRKAKALAPDSAVIANNLQILRSATARA